VQTTGGPNKCSAAGTRKEEERKAKNYMDEIVDRDRELVEGKCTDTEE
jgi:hypothetical protein